jgi:hypothetical protein
MTLAWGCIKSGIAGAVLDVVLGAILGLTLGFEA